MVVTVHGSQELIEGVIVLLRSFHEGRGRGVYGMV